MNELEIIDSLGTENQVVFTCRNNTNNAIRIISFLVIEVSTNVTILTGNFNNERIPPNDAIQVNVLLENLSNETSIVRIVTNRGLTFESREFQY